MRLAPRFWPAGGHLPGHAIDRMTNGRFEFECDCGHRAEYTAKDLGPQLQFIVFYPGYPRKTDTNFINRVFGKSGRGPEDTEKMREQTLRAIVGGSREHFQAAAAHWFRKQAA
jgi:hypothetical protein